jgi:hypothetical protein
VFDQKSDSKKVLAGTSSCIKCKFKLSMDTNSAVLFSPKLNENDDALNFSEGIYSVKRGRCHYINIEVMNPTKSDIYLKKGDVIGELCDVATVIPNVQ